jgi:hypothetical protein
MMSKIKLKIIRQDIFGKRISLNFDKRGESHKTLCGGIVTIIVMITILCFGLFRSYVMFNYSQVNLSSVNQP